MSIKVVTYNVLSDKLARPSHFTKCPKEDLFPEVRYNRTIKNLDYFVKQEQIICLQEVSITWRCKFAKYFELNNYHFECVNYSKPITGYMGVGIAFPKHKYTFKGLDIETISDLKKWPQYSYTLNDSIWSWLTWTSIPTHYSWNYMKYKQNQLICIRLLDNETNNQFIVANYHMPCAFSYEDIMVSHVSLCMKYIHELSISYDCPCIFAGDFNGQPDSKLYKYK